MNPRPYAYFAGTLLLLLGIAGFVPPLVTVEADPLRVAAGVGGPQLLGLFPTGIGTRILYILLGGWGLFAGVRLSRAVLFARASGTAFLLLLAMGTIPGLDTMFGAAPLYGNNLLLHGTLALLGLLFGWLYRRERVPAPAPEPERAAF